jgi:hypothetical protein
MVQQFVINNTDAKADILYYSLMLCKNSETFMLSKAQREYFNHPSTHPAKNVRHRRTQDEHFFCAASKHNMTKNNCLRNISYDPKIKIRTAPLGK